MTYFPWQFDPLIRRITFNFDPKVVMGLSESFLMGFCNLMITLQVLTSLAIICILRGAVYETFFDVSGLWCRVATRYTLALAQLKNSNISRQGRPARSACAIANPR
jgi:hypothetical protein